MDNETRPRETAPPDGVIADARPRVDSPHYGEDKARRKYAIGLPRRLSRPKLLKWGLGTAIALVGLFVALHYWRHAQLYASTDNAYINAHTVEVAAQVGGPVVALYVRDNEAVSEGQALFDIDPRAYDIALQKAQAQLDLARQSEARAQAAVSAAQAQLAQRRAELDNARSNNTRTRELRAGGFISRAGSEQAATQLATADAAVKAAEANVEQAQSALGKAGDDNAEVRAAMAAADQARLDLERTHVKATTSGTVSNLTLRPGDTVQAGVPLFVIIGSQEFWVDANFKETELKRIHPGQEVAIRVDMYPDRTFKGVVESVSGGSGTAFSLLPPQNATGNWVKVTQRVPVRIRIVDPSRPSAAHRDDGDRRGPHALRRRDRDVHANPPLLRREHRGTQRAAGRRRHRDRDEGRSDPARDLPQQRRERGARRRHRGAPSQR
jgi:membrane fusion protein, multidrug efflux system